MKNLNKDPVAERSSEKSSNRLFGFQKVGHGSFSLRQTLALLLVANPYFCHAQGTDFVLNEDDGTVIQPTPNTINEDSILTVSSLTYSDPYEPGDCFHFELSSDMEEIKDAEKYKPFMSEDIACEFNPPSKCTKISDYVMQVLIIQEESPDTTQIDDTTTDEDGDERRRRLQETVDEETEDASLIDNTQADDTTTEEEAEVEPVEEAPKILTINGTFGIRNPFMKSVQGQAALNLEKVTYIPQCDVSSTNQFSTSGRTGLNFAIPQSLNINDTVMTTNSSIVAEKTSVTIKFSSPNGISLSKGTIQLKAEIQEDFDPFKRAECKSGELEFNGTLQEFIIEDSSYDPSGGLLITYNSEASLPSTYTAGSPVNISIYCDSFINPLKESTIDTATVNYQQHKPFEVLDFSVEVQGIDIARSIQLDVSSFTPVSFKPNMFYFFVRNETTEVADLVIQFDFFSQYQDSEELGFYTTFDSCSLKLHLPIDIEDWEPLEFYSNSMLFTQDNKETQIESRVVMTISGERIPNEFYFDACKNGYVPIGPVQIRVSKVTVSESREFRPTLVGLWKSRTPDQFPPSKEIIREEKPEFILSDLINIGQTYNLKMQQNGLDKIMRLTEDDSLIKFSLDEDLNDSEEQQFVIMPALNGDIDAISIESASNPGFFLKQANSLCILEQDEIDSDLFKMAASFKVLPSDDRAYIKFKSVLTGDLIASPNNENVNMINFTTDLYTNSNLPSRNAPLGLQNQDFRTLFSSGQCYWSGTKYLETIWADQAYQSSNGNQAMYDRVMAVKPSERMMEYMRLQDLGWSHTGDKFYADQAYQRGLGQSANANGQALYDYIMSQDEEDRGPSYTRLNLTDWAVPSGSGNLNGEYWAIKGQELSGDSTVYTAIMTADEQYRAEEFTRLWTFKWDTGCSMEDADCSSETHWGDKAYQLGEEVADGQLFYDNILDEALGLRGNKFTQQADETDPNQWSYGITCNYLEDSQYQDYNQDEIYYEFNYTTPENTTDPSALWSLIQLSEQGSDQIILETHGTINQVSDDFENVSGEVSKESQVQMKLKTQSLLQTGSIFSVFLPKWNPFMPEINQTSYIEHSESINCKGIKNFDDNLTCSFEQYNQEYDRLSISNGISEDWNGGYSIFQPQHPPSNAIRTVLKLSMSLENFKTDVGSQDFIVQAFIDAQINATLFDGNKSYSYNESIEVKSLYEIDGKAILVYDLKANVSVSIQELAIINQNVLQEGPNKEQVIDAMQMDPFGKILTVVSEGQLKKLPEVYVGPVKSEDSELIIQLPKILNPLTMEQQTFKVMVEVSTGLDPPGSDIRSPPEIPVSNTQEENPQEESEDNQETEQEESEDNQETEQDAEPADDGGRRRMQEDDETTAEATTDDTEANLAADGTTEESTGDDDTEETVEESVPPEEPKIYVANELSEETCEEFNQNFYDGTEKVCYQCPNYFAADRTIMDCIQNTCNEDSEYLAINGECIKCDGQYEVNTDKSACVCKVITSIDEPRCGFMIIEQGSVNFQATSPTTISNVAVFGFNTTVGQRTDLQIQFDTEVLLGPGSRIKIQFANTFIIEDVNSIQVNKEGLFLLGDDSLDFDIGPDTIQVFPLIDQPFILPQVATNLTFSQVKNPQRSGDHPLSLTILDAADNLIAFNDQIYYTSTSWPLGQKLTGTKRQILSAGVHSFFYFSKQNKNILNNL